MKILPLFGLLALTPFATMAQIHITPSIGYTTGGSVESINNDSYDLEDDIVYSITAETDFDEGRLGLFYSNQSNNIKDLNFTSKLQYLHLQSALDFPITTNLSSFFGLSMGMTYADASWVDSNVRFSAGAFTGLQYHLSDNIALQVEGRWIGTSLDGDFDSSCSSNPTKTACVIKYEGDWLNQLQANFGVKFSF